MSRETEQEVETMVQRNRTRSRNNGPEKQNKEVETRNNQRQNKEEKVETMVQRNRTKRVE